MWVPSPSIFAKLCSLSKEIVGRARECEDGRSFAEQNSESESPKVRTGNQNLYAKIALRFLVLGFSQPSPTAKQKAPHEGVLFVLVEVRGIEPLSENLLIQLSPGAGRLLELFLGRADAQARSKSNRFMRDRFNGKPPMHVHH